ncbi:MAG: diaminopimelate decarboxylase [Candidatus Sumerlaeaceae bacterium]|nr:diaminopimelate decarboxylase [Candidatus Sumerlaeaceae bacterium]
MSKTEAAAQERERLESLAARVGTPFWVIDAGVLRRRIGEVKAVCGECGFQPRFAMKSLSTWRVLQEMRDQGIWIDAVSGNEVLRARRIGFPGGANPPVIMLTADVLRDNALEVILNERVLVNIGSPGMLRELEAAGYRGPVALRVNPGFGSGHSKGVDTGGPSSKHGVWFEDAGETAAEAARRGLKIIMLHAHIGSGPKLEELLANLNRLTQEFARMAKAFPDLEGFSLGGGIPFTYKEDAPPVEIAQLGPLFADARKRLCEAAGREVRVEIEPGRYFVAPAAHLVTRIRDIKSTRTNEKGTGKNFIMVDGGFVDLIRPAMYGSYHRISIVGRGATNPVEEFAVAGPVCESGDVFTRGSSDLIAPRPLPRPEIGDLLVLHDGGAYGYVMASNYNSVGRAPQVWLEEDGSAVLVSRRETLDDILKAEVEEKL